MNDQVNLNNGMNMPLIGFGLYRIDDQDTMDEAVRCAYDCGYRLFDTAQMYGNEVLLGQALKRCGIPRDDVFVTTKIDTRNMTPAALRESFQLSLQRLQSDHADLLLIHWPGQSKNRLRDCWKAMSELCAEGKARAIGLCNAVPHHLQWLEDMDIAPAVNQIEVNLHNVQENLSRLCAQKTIQVQAWAPLGRGDFSNALVQQLAAKYDCTPAQIILRWHLQRGIAVIPKSSHPERIRANIAIGKFSLSEEEIRQMNAQDAYKDTSHNPYTYDYEKTGD